MPTGDATQRGPHRRRERGATYLLLLFGLAIVGATLAAAGTAWSTAAQREREVELRFRGEQFRQAFDSYARSSPAGAPRYPTRLDELLDDRRSVPARRHLRRLYADPFTGAADWALLREGDRILGLHSRAGVRVFRAPPGLASDASARASDWHFGVGTPAAPAASPAGPLMPPPRVAAPPSPSA